MKNKNIANCIFSIIGFICCSFCLFSCQSESVETKANRQDTAPPQLIKVSVQKDQLLYIYKDNKEEEQRSTTINEIPESSRKSVQVIDLSLSPQERQSRDYVQIFDLSKANADGTYPGRVVLRKNLETALASEQALPEQPPIILYSTSWCGVCKKAKKFMQNKGLAFVEKDIEKDRQAARELQEKCDRAKVPMGGVPVIDVGGALLRGFDGDRLLSMLNTAQQTKVIK